MRYQNGIIIAVMLVLAAMTTLGSFYTDNYVKASHAQSAGFDALAHGLFDDVLKPGDEAVK